AEQTAQALAVLANGGVPTANPDNWWGLAPLSTDNPIHGLDEQRQPHRVRLSPSTVETAVQSPLQWFIYQILTIVAHLAAAPGAFLHAIAEIFPQANIVEMFTEFNTKFPVLAAEAGLTPGWEYDVLYAKAHRALEMYYAYVTAMRTGYKTGRGK